MEQKKAMTKKTHSCHQNCVLFQESQNIMIKKIDDLSNAILTLHENQKQFFVVLKERDQLISNLTRDKTCLSQKVSDVAKINYGLKKDNA